MALRVGINLAEQIVLMNDWLFVHPLHVNIFLRDRLGFDSLQITTLDRGVKLQELRVLCPMVPLHL